MKNFFIKVWRLFIFILKKIKNISFFAGVFFIILITWLLDRYTNLSWYYIVSLIASMATAVFIGFQLKYNKKLAEFTIMPNVFFTLKSGKTLAAASKKEEQIPINNPGLKEKLFTKIFINNNSKFPIYFWIEINLKINYKNKSPISKIYNPTPTEENPWRLNPGIWKFPCFEGMLCETIIKKEYNSLVQSDETSFNQEIKNIESINAYIQVSYAPFTDKNFKFKIDPEKWRFDLEEFVWVDSQGTKDYNIKFT